MSFSRTSTTLKPTEQIGAFLNWMETAGVDRFDLALIRFGVNNPAGVFIPGSTNLDRTGLEKSLPWMRYENSRTAGVYFRPARGRAWPLLFLDDVAPDEAHLLADRYSAALIETSAGRFHVWLLTDSTLNERQRYEAQATLAKQAGADPGSVSGEHWGRLPGFKNRKLGKEDWVNLRRLSIGVSYPVSHFPEVTCGLAPQPRVKPQSANGDERDQSAVEWKFVRSALEAGVPPTVVERQLLEQCADRRGQDAQRYVTRTMRRASAKHR